MEDDLADSGGENSLSEVSLSAEDRRRCLDFFFFVRFVVSPVVVVVAAEVAVLSVFSEAASAAPRCFFFFRFIFGAASTRVSLFVGLLLRLLLLPLSNSVSIF